ncbi:hypothetical protein H5410_061107 [Solanum commersonii]|uniref:Uncharacterized protein n=1 Tax=Solanum commersonii TaxID=4109 RepID=A0A9J5W6V2_SOLCO|nr:hypothetical protein H5410_061107 [Solanum commersonii]
MTRRLALLLSHRRLVISFIIFTFWTIGRYSTASRNYSGLCILEQRAESVLSAIRQRYLYCFVKLIDHSPIAPFLTFRSTSFKDSRTGTKGDACQFGDLPSWTR